MAIHTLTVPNILYTFPSTHGVGVGVGYHHRYSIFNFKNILKSKVTETVCIMTINGIYMGICLMLWAYPFGAVEYPIFRAFPSMRFHPVTGIDLK